MRDKVSLSLKQGPIWPGLSTLSDQGRLGGANFKVLRGCYVSEDGTLLKRFPGFAPVFDLNYGALTSSTFKFHHGFKMMPGGRLFVVSEDDESTAGDGATHDSLFVHIKEDTGVVGAAAQNADFEFEVANRYGKGSRFGGIPANLSFARGQQVLPYKPGLEIVDDRLLINVPGYECIFQVPSMSRIVSEGQPQIAYTPRCLGVPKAIINDVDTGQGAGGALADGDYWIRVAYKDQYTGEVGLASEALKVTIAAGGGTGAVELYVVWPGEHMPECLALNAILFVSKRNANKEFMGAVKEFTIPANTDASTRGTVLAGTFSWNETTDIDWTYAPPRLEQMPAGAKSMRTLRGFTFFGGKQGDYGDDGQFILGPVRKYTDPTLGDILVTNAIDDAQDGTTPIYKQGFGIGSQSIPTALAGLIAKTFTFFTGGKYSERADRTINQRQASTGLNAANAHEEINHTILHEKITTMNANEHAMQVNLDRGIMQFSEQGFPGVIPAINRIFADTDFGEDIEGIGKTGNTLIICTRNQTYGLSFASGPRGRPPVQLSTRFGCIAPNSMVEFDGGVAWLSDRGPVAMIGNTVQWVGRPLRDHFVGPDSIYTRDSRGMMYHSVGVHDPERALVIIGVNKDSPGADATWGSFSLDITHYQDVGLPATRAPQVEITTSVAHGLRAGDIFYSNGFDAASGGEFLNGFHRVYEVPTPTTLRFMSTNTAGLTPVSGPKLYKNGEMSKFGCDELLIWSYSTNKWSTFQMPRGLRCVWLDRVQVEDGSWRTAFMDQNGVIYAFDDLWGDRVQNTVNLSVTMASSTTFIGTHADLKVGHSFYVIKVGEPENLFASGIITNITGSTITFELPAIEAFANYDASASYVMSAGQHEIEFEMEYVLPTGELTTPACSREVAIRSTGSGNGFAKITLSTEKETVDMTPKAMEQWRTAVYEGAVRGHDHKVYGKIVGSPAISIEDIELQVSQA